MSNYDKHVQRLQNMSPFNIQRLDESGEPVDWWEIEPSTLVGMVLIDEATLHQSILDLGVQVMEWARYVSWCQRICDVHERRLRVFKAKMIVAGKEKDPKVAIALLEAAYRQLPEYEELSVAVDRATDAYNSTCAVVEALKAKREMLKTFARRMHDGNPEILAG